MLSRAKKQKLDKEAAENSRKIEQNAAAGSSRNIEQNTAGSSRNTDIEKIGRNAAAGSSGYIDTGRNGQNAAGSSKDIEKICKDAAASAFFNPHYIPIEIWNQVFQYVSIFDLKRLSLTCKNFYQTIGFLPDAMDRIVLKIRRIPTVKDQAKLLESSRQYRNIELSIFGKVGRNKKRNFQKFLEGQAKFIRDLKLVNIPVFESSNSFNLMSNLENFSIFTEESEIFNADLDFVCPSVKKLIFKLPNDISETSFLSFIKRFPNIKEVSIGMKVGVSLMKSLAGNCPNLKKISMWKFNHEFLKDLIFENLVEFVIEDYHENVYNHNQNNNFEQAAKAFENLKILKIESYHVELNLSSLLWILENLKKLTHLEIENGRQFTEEELCRNSEHFKNLKVLTISNTEESMDEFQHRLQRFPALNFTYSQHLDSEYSDSYNGVYWGYGSETDSDDWDFYHNYYEVDEDDF